MTQKEFAKRVLKVSPAVFSQVLKGHRNFGNDNAERVAVILLSDKDIWRNPRKAELRILAWKKFSDGEITK